MWTIYTAEMRDAEAESEADDIRCSLLLLGCAAAASSGKNSDMGE